MWQGLKKSFSFSKNLFLVLAVLQSLLMVLVQAGHDYGWLGVALVALVLFPFIWLLPIFGWWFLPLSGMVWLVVFCVIAGLFAILERWAHRRWEAKMIRGALHDALK